MNSIGTVRSIIDRGDSRSIDITTLRGVSIEVHMCLRDPIRSNHHNKVNDINA